jgi:hypothetical protein
MAAQIDWKRLADEEWALNDQERETKTNSGLVIPQFTTGQRLRAWIKFRGEPAMRLVETPAAFAARWLAFKQDESQELCVFHEHEFGQAIFVFRPGIPELMYIGVTYPDTSQGRTTPGSIWAHECGCHRYGGPCPKLD